MLKFLITCVQVLSGFYLAGDMARQNPKINDFVAHLEDGYGSFNARLKDIKVRDGLNALRKFYRYISIISIACFFMLPKIVGPNQLLAGYLSSIGMVSMFGWFSIKWCIDHKNALTGIRPQVGLMIFGPVILGIFDTFFETPFVTILTQPLYKISIPLGLHVPHLTNPIAIGGCLSLIFAIFFLIYYILTWLLAAPAAFLSAAFVLLPVAAARLIHTVAPRKAFVGLALILFATTSFGLLLF
ncbi:hypothetical protein K6W26_12100 [Burkholderia sp. AU42008]|uniref:hypothetical protein n=1 Tax=unclassified Burkholderia TaxID=2613784 RepID=UPI001178931A|nr:MULTISPECIES: hypothetical protein [unclassified Burkholderia]MBR8235289.1 hypothetical protein [Burkholderia sp. AU32357]MBY4873811.1 hypothetical protein [Burkholderia sp. AU42008]